MRLTLSPRLSAIAELLADTDSFADVGTDHGKLPVFALQEGIVSKAIATDISKNSLNKAKLLAEISGVELITRCGDGLSVLKEGEVETVVIAGMGGLEMINILENAPCTFDNYIFLPHTKSHELRVYLKSRDIGIDKDFLIKESGKFYNLITCRISNKWNNARLYIGEDNVGLKVFLEYYAKRKAQILSLIEIEPANKLRFESELTELEEIYNESI